MSRQNGIGKHPGTLIFGSIVGGAAGTIATLLFTPWPGQRLREQLFGPVAGAVSPAVEKAGSVAQSVTAKGSSLAAPAVDTVTSVVQKGTEKGSAVVYGATTQLQNLRGGAEEPPPPTPEASNGKPLTTL